ncbi:HAMP domain-containing sensor histidine kinase [Mucilaginibacter galii]|uniref:histidine kinase n=1 Tax=Mucilaginibacter galii TaxID=2005073 RepID=A0A917N305_9SPHI|nr:hypothetical protein GCM10011425_36550 [Mucilaginibacter galii]
MKKAGDTANGTFLEKMELQVLRLEKLIRDLLEITRIESGKLSLHPEPLPFKEFLEQIISDLQLITNMHQLILTENSVLTITADPTRLTQVITNLVTNAVKYSPEGKKVEIAAKEENGFMICSVKDFGVGIAANEQSLIFERFHQVAGKNPNAGLSLGLGLYIAKEIVEEGSGKLWLESEPNKGSIFYFSVPLT